MLASTQSFLDELDQKAIKYKNEGTTNSGKDVIRVGFTGKNMTTVPLMFFFNTDCEDVAIRSFDILKVPEGKEGIMLHAVNLMNNRYRFAKFCLDLRDNTIQMEMDASFRDHDVGAVCCELLARSVSICDEAYSEFMKALWS